MKVLMYGNRKEPYSFWDISSPEKEEAGVKCLFKHLDEVWQMFLNEPYAFDDEILKLQEVESLFNENKIPELFLNDAEKKIKQLYMMLEEKRRVEAEKVLVEKSREGDVKSIKKLLLMIKGQEYADWSIINVMNPLEQ